MGDQRVLRTAKETNYVGGSHRHIAALCTAASRVPKALAVTQIRRGTDSYWTLADGQRANVVVVDRCERCGTDYLRTDRDSTVRNNLLELPDC